jgi:hypothetical protein
MLLFISDQMAPVYCIMLQGERRPLSSVSSCSLTTGHVLKGHGNEANFLEFLHKLDPHRPLHYLSSRSDFGFEFAEIFVIRKRLPDSAIRRVGDSPTRWVGESATLRLGESGSRWLADWASRGVGFWMFKRKLGESESRRLPESVSRGVAMVSRGVAIRIF